MREGAQGGLLLRLAAIRSRLAQAERRAGREAGSTRILYATKYASAKQVAYLAAAEPGMAIGENRVQDAQEKFEHLSGILGEKKFSAIEKHFIGSLQSNKVRGAVSLFGCIQSVSSLSLAEKISSSALRQGKEMRVYIEVNNGEAGKHGASPEDAWQLASKIRALPALRLEGFMGMGVQGDPEATRRFFRLLRSKADSLGLKTSMGMSEDFEMAAEEGSDLVRLGRAVFEAERVE